MTAVDQLALVREFHAARDFWIADRPTVPPDLIREERAGLVAEEAGELVARLLQGHPQATEVLRRVAARFAAKAVALAGPMDLVQVTAEAVDVQYVVAGAGVNCGLPLAEAFRLVHAANMLKRGIDQFGKAGKPPGWRPADLSGLILAAGAA